MSSILQISNKPLKNTKGVKQGFFKIHWDKTPEKNAQTISTVK